MDDALRIVNVEEMTFEHREYSEGYAFDRHEIPSGEGSSACCVRVYRIPPGKANYPYHYHETHEEIFYILQGQGAVLSENGERPLRPGDVMICPPLAAGAHKIVNTSAEEVLVYLEVDAVSFPDVAHYPLTNGMGVLFADRERNEFYKDGKRVPYSDVCE